jgi:hypothetical protein
VAASSANSRQPPRARAEIPHRLDIGRGTHHAVPPVHRGVVKEQVAEERRPGDHATQHNPADTPSDGGPVEAPASVRGEGRQCQPRNGRQQKRRLGQNGQAEAGTARQQPQRAAARRWIGRAPQAGVDASQDETGGVFFSDISQFQQHVAVGQQRIVGGGQASDKRSAERTAHHEEHQHDRDHREDALERSDGIEGTSPGRQCDRVEHVDARGFGVGGVAVEHRPVEKLQRHGRIDPGVRTWPCGCDVVQR